MCRCALGVPMWFSSAHMRAHVRMDLVCAWFRCPCVHGFVAHVCMVSLCNHVCVHLSMSSERVSCVFVWPPEYAAPSPLLPSLPAAPPTWMYLPLSRTYARIAAPTPVSHSPLLRLMSRSAAVGSALMLRAFWPWQAGRQAGGPQGGGHRHAG